MSFMRGKFYVFESRNGVEIMVGRDFTEETIAEERARFREVYERDGRTTPPEVEKMFTGHEVDPVELRTGNIEPKSISLPSEIFYSLVMRAYDRMTDEERERYRGRTKWERYWDERFGMIDDD